MDKTQDVSIYTDGGGSKEYGTNAALLISDDNRYMIMCEAVEDTTSNRMELSGVINAIRALTVPCRVTVYSDSRYVVDSYNKGWVYNWSGNGWVTSSGRLAKNIDLWTMFLDVIAPHSLRMVWVQGHASNRGNIVVDSLCTAAYNRCL